MYEHRDYVWQCDYGERNPVFECLSYLLSNQNAYQLGMCSLFVNNNPYQLEFYVVLGYENPSDNQIIEMTERMTSVGVRPRADLSLQRLLDHTKNNRFNSVALSNPLQLQEAYEKLFFFPDRATYAKKFSNRPLGNSLPIFLSHSSKDKPFVEDLIPFLTRYDLPVWYDKVNISYGESIANAVMTGIDDSGAVLFFITKSFLESNWCKEEMESFISRHCEGDNILLISVVFPDVEHSSLPRFIKNKKYLRLENDTSIKVVANEIVPSLKTFFEL